MPKVSKVLATDLDGKQVWMTQAQADALEILEQANRGGCAAVKGYVPSTGYLPGKCPTKNIQMLTRFSYPNLVQRKLDALNAITFEDVQPHLTAPKLTALSLDSLRELFEQRKAQEVASLEKTLSGDRSDAHRQGHDRCYARFAEGVKVHLETKKGKDGLMYPVLTNGYPTVKSIMVHFLELNSTTIVEGERKVVNSGAPVLMRNAINKVLNQRSVGIRSLSLKEDNFEKLSIHHDVIVPEMIAEAVSSS
jgi:hypothetical protein